ncbi:hypothetical protein V3C99_008017 [Haemonchus contortus]
MDRTSGGSFGTDLQKLSELRNDERKRCTRCGKEKLHPKKSGSNRRSKTEASKVRDIESATKKQTLHRKSVSRKRASTKHRKPVSRNALRRSRKLSEGSLNSQKRKRGGDLNLHKDEDRTQGLKKSNLVVYRDSRGRFAKKPHLN